MLTTATICLLLGAVLGLKFNLKMIVHAIALSSLFWIVAAVSGQISMGGAVLDAILAAVMLQVGYFVSLLIAMLGLTGEHEYGGATSPEPVKTFEVPGNLHKNT